MTEPITKTKAVSPARIIVVVARPSGRQYEYLLLRKRKGGYWQPVAGHLEAIDFMKKKPHAAALRRELEEETGLKPGKLIRLGTVDRPSSKPPTARAAQVHLKIVKRDAYVRLSKEHTGLKWVKKPAALKALRHSARFVAAVRMADARLQP